MPLNHNAHAVSDLEALSRQIRGKIVEMSHTSRAAHLGSSLSCVDILVAAYWAALRIDLRHPSDPERDRFILSKGHAAAALFATLAYRGFFERGLLDDFGKPGNCLEEHPGPGRVPGVEAATGSLGHGLSLALGMSLACRIQGRSYRIYSLLSDGECNEGSVWEAAMFASSHHLENVMAIVDYNKWQATGRSCEVMALEPLAEKWRTFGWTAHEIDGHDMQALVDVLNEFPDGSGNPVVVIAHTIKGRGISFMEDDNNWHYRIPTSEEVARSKKELGLL